jgi:hypothetical protein
VDDVVGSRSDMWGLQIADFGLADFARSGAQSSVKINLQLWFPVSRPLFPMPSHSRSTSAMTVRPEVLEAMLPYLGTGRSESFELAPHFGRIAQAGLEQARREVAEAAEQTRGRSYSPRWSEADWPSR